MNKRMLNVRITLTVILFLIISIVIFASGRHDLILAYISSFSSIISAAALMFAIYQWKINQRETEENKRATEEQEQIKARKRARPVFYYSDGHIYMNTLAQTPVINTVLKWKNPKSNIIHTQELGGISSGKDFFVKEQFAWIFISTVTAEFETIYAVINSKKETYHIIESHDMFSKSHITMLDYQLNDVRNKNATLKELGEIEAFNIVESYKPSYDNTKISDLTEYTANIRLDFENERYKDAVGNLVKLSQSKELNKEEALKILDSISGMINDFDLKEMNKNKRKAEIAYLVGKLHESYRPGIQPSSDYLKFVQKWSSEINQGYISAYGMYEFLNDIKTLIRLENVCNVEVFLDALYYYVNYCIVIASPWSVKAKLKETLQLLSTLNK